MVTIIITSTIAMLARMLLDHLSNAMLVHVSCYLSEGFV